MPQIVMTTVQDGLPKPKNLDPANPPDIKTVQLRLISHTDNLAQNHVDGIDTNLFDHIIHYTNDFYSICVRHSNCMTQNRQETLNIWLYQGKGLYKIEIQQYNALNKRVILQPPKKTGLTVNEVLTGTEIARTIALKTIYDIHKLTTRQFNFPCITDDMESAIKAQLNIQED